MINVLYLGLDFGLKSFSVLYISISLSNLLLFLKSDSFTFNLYFFIKLCNSFKDFLLNIFLNSLFGLAFDNS